MSLKLSVFAFGEAYLVNQIAASSNLFPLISKAKMQSSLLNPKVINLWTFSENK